MSYIKNFGKLISMRNLFLILALFLISSCGSNKLLNKVINKPTPYEKYLSSLKDAGLDKTALGSDWIKAGEKVLKDSVTVTLPYKESGYFSAANPSAASYRFFARAGEVITVSLETNSLDDAHIFADLFILGEKTEHLNAMDTMKNLLEYEVEEDDHFILRLQPELLRSARFTMSITAQPALAFPVQGAGNKAVRSFFGAERDAGRRKHEGIDIFVARGTPALAAAEGRVSRVNNNRLGGKVVWLSDADRNQSYYYAHLDSQLVQSGQRVMPGDTLGLIGNTGNAITTPPHLHFGIYRSGQGAIDPYPYVRESMAEAAVIKVRLESLGLWHRIAAGNTNLRLSPSTASPIITTLPEDTPLFTQAGTDDWFRIILPDGTKGFVYSSLIEPLTSPIETETIKNDAVIYDHANALAAVMDSVFAGSTINLFGKFNDFLLVKNEKGNLGWIQSEINISYK